PEHPQKRLRMHGARAHFDVERLLEQAALRDPVFRELEDEVLECDHSTYRAWRISRSTRADFNSFSRWRLSNRLCTVSSSRAARASSGNECRRSGAVAPDALRNRNAS